MTDEIRVTFVATGIGNEKKPDITLVAGGKAKVAQAPQPQPQAQSVAPQAEEKPAQTLQTTPVQEKPQVTPQPTNTVSSSPASSAGQSSAAPKPEKESGYLDIPAFLRRQAD